jgi:hypothetical protein
MATWTSWYTAPDWYKRELIKYAAKCQVRLTIDNEVGWFTKTCSYTVEGRPVDVTRFKRGVLAWNDRINGRP